MKIIHEIHVLMIESPWLTAVIAVAAILIVLVLLLIGGYMSRKRRESGGYVRENLKEREKRVKDNL